MANPPPPPSSSPAAMESFMRSKCNQLVLHAEISPAGTAGSCLRIHDSRILFSSEIISERKEGWQGARESSVWSMVSVWRVKESKVGEGETRWFLINAFRAALKRFFFFFFFFFFFEERFSFSTTIRESFAFSFEFWVFPTCRVLPLRILCESCSTTRDKYVKVN